jgi:hypothetical protein
MVLGDSLAWEIKMVARSIRYASVTRERGGRESTAASSFPEAKKLGLWGGEEEASAEHAFAHLNLRNPALRLD